MKGKVVGVQRELNEIAQELVRHGFEVTDILDTSKSLDALVYYNDESNNIHLGGFNNTSSKGILKLNAAQNTIDEIVVKIKEI